MSRSSPQYGQEDQTPQLMPLGTRMAIKAGLFVAGAVVCWHVAVVATSTGVAWTSPAPLSQLFDLAPLAIKGSDVADHPVLTLAVFFVLLVVMLAIATYAGTKYRIRQKARRTKGFASETSVRDKLGEEAARKSAAQSRPTLSAKQRRTVDISDLSLRLGETKAGQEVFLPLEDHACIFAPTGGGKTVNVTIPAALTAPGALIVTTTKPDILDVIYETRRRKGRVWVFDPMDRVGWPTPMVWNPVAGCEDGEAAISRGMAFTAGLAADERSSTNSSFFKANASSAMARLLHAAALGDRPMGDVINWALRLDNGADRPQQIIKDSDDPRAETAFASILRNVATGADQTVASSRQTLAQAIDPLVLNKVQRWVTPRQGVAEFNSSTFLESKDTLVMIADASANSNVAPLCSMLFQDLTDTVKAKAGKTVHGRLQIPLRIDGDEIANVCPLPKLPDLATDARSFGMQLILSFQSVSQVRRRWGADGAKSLLDQMNAELVLGGIKDDETLKRYSLLVGDEEVARMSASYSTHGLRTSSSSQTQTKTVMRADQIRTIESDSALLIHRSNDPIMLNLVPWYRGPDAKRLAKDKAKTAQMRTSA